MHKTHNSTETAPVLVVFSRLMKRVWYVYNRISFICRDCSWQERTSILTRVAENWTHCLRFYMPGDSRNFLQNFHRKFPAPGSVHFKLCFSSYPYLSVAGRPHICSGYSTAMSPQLPWPRRGPCPEQGSPVPRGHSCTREVSNNLTPPRGDCRSHKWIR